MPRSTCHLSWLKFGHPTTKPAKISQTPEPDDLKTQKTLSKATDKQTLSKESDGLKTRTHILDKEPDGLKTKKKPYAKNRIKQALSKESDGLKTRTHILDKEPDGLKTKNKPYAKNRIKQALSKGPDGLKNQKRNHKQMLS